MKLIRALLFAVVGPVLLLSLWACGSGGSGSGSGQVRLLNATRTHVSLDLLSGGSRVISAVAAGSASSYVGVSGGTASLQLTDASSQATLTTSAPAVTSGQSYTLVAYESGGSVKTAWLTENDTAPSSGTASLRTFDLATDAGTLDVYVTAPDTVLGASVAPSFALGALGTIQTSSFSSVTAGTYRVRVTGAGDPADLRLDLPAVSLGSTQLVTLMLLPSAGGGLLDGATAVEKGDVALVASGFARVRLVSGLPGGSVAASNAAGVVEAGSEPPASLLPVSLQTGLNVVGNGVYTVFVLGDAASPVTVLRRDR